MTECDKCHKDIERNECICPMVGVEEPDEVEKFDVKYHDESWLRGNIRDCQNALHIHQVSFSTYHDCLTQVCFTCKRVRTSMEKEEK